MHPGNHAIRVREADGLSQERGEAPLAAGGRQYSRRIGILEVVAREGNAAVGSAIVGSRIAESLYARRVEGGDVAQPIAGAHDGLVHGVPCHTHARLPVVQVALVGHAVAGAGKQQPAFYRKARLQGVNHLYGAIGVEVEARIDLVVALRKRRFKVPAQSVAEGQGVGNAPVVLHEEAIIVIAIGQRRVDGHAAAIRHAQQQRGNRVAVGGVRGQRVLLRPAGREGVAAEVGGG